MRKVTDKKLELIAGGFHTVCVVSIAGTALEAAGFDVTFGSCPVGASVGASREQGDAVVSLHE